MVLVSSFEVASCYLVTGTLTYQVVVFGWLLSLFLRKQASQPAKLEEPDREVARTPTGALRLH